VASQLKKFQTPANKTQTISKFEFPINQPSFEFFFVFSEQIFENANPYAHG